jgi:alpha-tubulin suppressor-like RCC1 family protein
VGPARIPGPPLGAAPSAAWAAIAPLAALIAALLAVLVAALLAPALVAAADKSQPPVQLPPIQQLTVGSQHACVLVEGGEVWCWGFATDGALGAGPDVTSTDVPVRALLPRPAIAIDAGFEGTCAITDDGAAWCWGRNLSGEVGDGTTEDRFEPTRVTGLPGPAVGISRGHAHACAVLDNGSGWCWGDNVVGELGNGRPTGSAATESRPVRIEGVPSLRAVSAGGGFTCALTDGGAAWCWGNDLHGELGRTGSYDFETPGIVEGLDGGVDLVATGDDQACAIRDGVLLCWGLMDEAKAATDPPAASWPTPRAVDLGARVVDVSLANGYHRCARDETGATWCWGNAEVRQLGPSVAADAVWVLAPVRQDVPPARDLETGYDFTCAVFAGDDLRCWGEGDPVARNPWTGEAGAPAGGFREPGLLVPTITTYIPTPRDISTDPPVVGANLLLAALVMLLFTIAGELLNRTLAANEDVLVARGGRPARLRAARLRVDTAVARRLGTGRLLTLVRLAGIAAIYGFVFSLLDRTWDPFSITGAWLFLSMAIAFGIVGIADDLACWSVARRWGVAADLDLRPGNLLVAVASTLASRVAPVIPGVMIGMPEALKVDTDALDGRRRGRLAAAGLGTLVAVGLVAWGVTFATSLVGPGAGEGALAVIGGVQAFCLVVFAVTVQNGFAQLLAFGGSPGGILRTTHRWTWLVALLAITFLFWHTLVNPRGDLAAALRATNVVAFVGTAVGFVAVAGGAWLWFTVRRRRARSRAADADGMPEQPVSLHPAPTPPSVAPAVVPALAIPATALLATAGTHPALEFELRAVDNRRLRGRVHILLRPDGVGVSGTWIRARADRIERVVGAAATLLLTLGAVGILLLTTIPGFRFYRVPWLLPSAAVATVVVGLVLVLLQLWRARQRWSGEVAITAEQLVSVRRSLNRGPLIAACILLTPLGGALYAVLVGPTVVRLRGPFDPERSAVVEVRLRCRDRDEASDVAARVAAIRRPLIAPEVHSS